MTPAGMAQICQIGGTRMTTSMAPSPAPLVMPTTSGEASGLRMAPCRNTPATARAAPASSETTIRGARYCVTIKAFSPPNRPSMTWGMESGTAPMVMLKMATATSSAAMTAQMAVVPRADLGAAA